MIELLMQSWTRFSKTIKHGANTWEENTVYGEINMFASALVLDLVLAYFPCSLKLSFLYMDCSCDVSGSLKDSKKCNKERFFTWASICLSGVKQLMYALCQSAYATFFIMWVLQMQRYLSIHIYRYVLFSEKYMYRFFFLLLITYFVAIVQYIFRWRMNSTDCWLEMSALSLEKTLSLLMAEMMSLSYGRL